MNCSSDSLKSHQSQKENQRYTYRIEDVSRYVHAQTRQRSCSEAASCARCHVRVVGCRHSCCSLCSSLLLRQQRWARSWFLVLFFQWYLDFRGNHWTIALEVIWFFVLILNWCQVARICDPSGVMKS